MGKDAIELKYGMLLEALPLQNPGQKVYSSDGMMKGLHMGSYGSKATPVKKLTGGHYNLQGGDIVFQAKGKHALNAITVQMQKLSTVRVRFGPRGPYMVEVHGEEAQSDQRMETCSIVSRYQYYLYLSIWSSETPFMAGVTSVVGQVAGFAGALLAAGLHPHVAEELTELQEGVKTAVEAAKLAVEAYSKGREVKEASERLTPQDQKARSLMLEILESDHVRLTFTSRKRDGGSSVLIATHRHTHSMPSYVKDIAAAINAALGGGAVAAHA